MLNNLGIRWFNGLTVIQFNMPQAMLDGPLGASATITYSFRLNTSFAPRSNYGRDLTAMRQPFLLVAGLADEAFIAEQYEPTISAHTDSGSYVLLPDVGHIDLLTATRTSRSISRLDFHFRVEGALPIDRHQTFSRTCAFLQNSIPYSIHYVQKRREK